MPSDDNTVNITARPYHHGDLRAALLAEGLRLLSARDAASLSLRAVARGVGVSPTAVYRHFPDKDALLSVLAAEGLSRLAAAQRAAAATGRAYVRFALAEPALFRLVFSSPVLPAGIPDLPEHANPARLLRDNAAVLAAADGSDARLRAVRSWALVHVLAMLMLDGRLPADDALIDRAVAPD